MSMLLLLLLLFCTSFAQDTSRQIASHMQRIVEKLQRHEFRSNQVGEQTLQVLARLEQNQKEQTGTLTAVTNTLMRMEARIANIENGLQQRDAIDRANMNEVKANFASMKKMLDDTMSVDQGNKILRRINKKMNEMSQELQDFGRAIHSNLTDQVNLGSQVEALSHQIEANNNVHGLLETIQNMSATQNVIKSTLTDSAGFTETIWQEVSGILGELVDRMTGMGKVVLDSADLALDTKRLLEYGIQQIVFEVEHIPLKKVLETVLSDFSTGILTNQTIGLFNMTNQLDGEVSRVWRQINLMYSTLSDSQSVLENVQNQTKSYVNESLSKVESMDGQVGKVLLRMVDVEENLNYLLKHLSHIVSDFNKMKGVLGGQFDNIREEFAAIYSKIAGNVTESGPDSKGPIPIQNQNVNNDLEQD